MQWDHQQEEEQDSLECRSKCLLCTGASYEQLVQSPLKIDGRFPRSRKYLGMLNNLPFHIQSLLQNFSITGFMWRYEMDWLPVACWDICSEGVWSTKNRCSKAQAQVIIDIDINNEVFMKVYVKAWSKSKLSQNSFDLN